MCQSNSCWNLLSGSPCFVHGELFHCVWDADETSLSFTHQPNRVLARVGSKVVHGRVSNSRESVSMMATINAVGMSMSPLLIFKGKTHRTVSSLVTSDGPAGAGYTFQKNAWMEDVLATAWFENIFLKSCGPDRPQLLLWDNHHSHETLDILEMAKANNIIVLALPPHTTHYLCPLDRTVFGPLKKSYNTVCSQHMSSDPGNTVNKKSFCKIINEAYAASFTRTNIVSGFEGTGVFQWNPLALPTVAFAPAETFDRDPNQTAKKGEHPLMWVMRQLSLTDSQEGDEEPTATISAVEAVPVPEVAAVFTIEGDQPVQGSETVDDQAVQDPQPGTSALVDLSGHALGSVISEVTEPVELTGPSDNFMPLDVVFGDGTSETILLPIEVEANTDKKASSWMEEVTQIFSSPTVKAEPLSSQQGPTTEKRKHTFARIMTSDEVLNMKREEANKKIKAEEEKENIKRQRAKNLKEEADRKVKAEEEKENRKRQRAENLKSKNSKQAKKSKTKIEKS